MSFIVSPTAKSWVKVDPDSHFPIQNLPFGMVELGGDQHTLVTRIGDYAVDVIALADEGLISDDPFEEFEGLAEMGHEVVLELRKSLFDLFREGNPKLRDSAKLKKEVMLPADQVQMLLPTEVTAFVDFYSGINHASNVGKMFRPEMEPLLPNYRHLPVAYNGRASSVNPSEIPIIRPKGQMKAAKSETPTYGPTREVDFELEHGYYIAEVNDLGQTLAVDEAERHMLGIVLVNDWSARDIQRWEYQPLGPFLAKSFATSISPWLVTMDALEPFRTRGPVQSPEPLPHLEGLESRTFRHHVLEAALQTAKMSQPQVITRTNAQASCVLEFRPATCPPAVQRNPYRTRRSLRLGHNQRIRRAHSARCWNCRGGEARRFGWKKPAKSGDSSRMATP